MKPPRIPTMVIAGDFAIIRARKTKHGPRRRWREFEYAQAAVQRLYPRGVPRGVNQKKLTRDVNALLATDREYCAAGFGEVSRNTVLRVLELLQSF